MQLFGHRLIRQPAQLSAQPSHDAPHPDNLSGTATVQHRRSRQSETFTNPLADLGPAYLYDLPFLRLRLALLYSFNELIVT
jgi:hypothetical protein